MNEPGYYIPTKGLHIQIRDLCSEHAKLCALPEEEMTHKMYERRGYLTGQIQMLRDLLKTADYVGG